MPRDRHEFREACKAWLQDALALLSDKPVPLTNDVDVHLWRYGDSMRLSVGRKAQASYDRLVSDHRESLVALAATSRLAQAVAANPQIIAALFADSLDYEPDPELSPDVIERNFASGLLHAYLAGGRGPRLRFSQHRFERLYEQLHQYVYSPASIDVSIIHLFHNLGGPIPNIELDTRLRLRPCTIAEQREACVEYFKGQSNFGSSPLVFRDIPPLGCLELVTKMPGHGFNDGVNKLNDIAKPTGLRFQRVLRLIRSEPIAIGALWLRSTNVFAQEPLAMNDRGTGESLPGDAHRLRGGDPPAYFIRTENIPAIKGMWARCGAQPTDRRLNLALNRLDDAYRRRTLEDRLVDYWMPWSRSFRSVKREEI